MSDAPPTAAKPESNPWCTTQSPILDQHEYVERVLEGYRQTRTTAGIVRSADRRLAIQLYRQGVPIVLVEAAFALAAARRIFRRQQRPPLEPIRSLHYFLPVIDEIRKSPIDPEYIEAQKWKLKHCEQYSRWIGIALE
jgi:hypothetical protein